ncbi:BgTH12-03263 [Blumeria graminis f. sp. triticale]|uniref:BgTH12-03263 n=1 Tax=Blumeria graminis f. sp. triticale TaxID=1689686 RepID=A0A9W4GG87_BLUGR|nr:BgTH12-03263 [Blumeria graminis f. sp. triticale]
MDLAYDHIQEEALAPEKKLERNEKQPETTLNSDFQEAYKAISSSPWGAKLGGFFGSVVKQGEEVYKEAQKELSEVGEEATKGLTGLRSTLISRTKGFSLRIPSPSIDAPENSGLEEKEIQAEEVLTPSGGVLARLRSEASKRLKKIEEAEDAADEALLKFGTNIRNLFRDAITIAPPSELSEGQQDSVKFESKDASGRRFIHTTRFDAQLHVIHTSSESFTQNSPSDEYNEWAKKFDVESQTEAISKDLDLYVELRGLMEKLVPDTISYTDFWTRYYFLRHSIETAEARRKDLLKGAAASAELEVGWDEDSDDEKDAKTEVKPVKESISAHSSATILPGKFPVGPRLLNAEESRCSQDEKSIADSEASYDVVGCASAAPSNAAGSPKLDKDEESEEDWE